MTRLAGSPIEGIVLNRKVERGQTVAASFQTPELFVIASDLTPGGFQGRTSGGALAKKLDLLRSEGITFKNGRLADPRRAIR